MTDTPRQTTDQPINLLAELKAALNPPKEVYPLYLVSRAKRGFGQAMNADPERIIRSIGDTESLGNSRYAIPITDRNGTKYRVTVEVVA